MKKVIQAGPVQKRRKELAWNRIQIRRGTQFGRLTVLEETEKRNTLRHFLCNCDCGRTKTVSLKKLRAGTKSCGCLIIEKLVERRRTHGLSGTPEYLVWNTMKDRVLNKNSPAYVRYGGREIGVCDRWKTFDNFIADMGFRPSPKLSLERIDNNRDYCPENCKWATRAEQDRNSRNNRNITINGATKCLTDWCAIAGKNIGTVWDRLARGMTPEEALFTPISKR